MERFIEYVKKRDLKENINSIASNPGGNVAQDPKVQQAMNDADAAARGDLNDPKTREKLAKAKSVLAQAKTVKDAGDVQKLKQDLTQTQQGAPGTLVQNNAMMKMKKK